MGKEKKEIDTLRLTFGIAGRLLLRRLRSIAVPAARWRCLAVHQATLAALCGRGKFVYDARRLLHLLRLQLQLGIREQFVLLLHQALRRQLEVAALPHELPLEQLTWLVVTVGQVLQVKDAWIVIDAKNQRWFHRQRRRRRRSPFAQSLNLSHAVSSTELHPHKATLDPALKVRALLQQQLQRASTEEELVQIHGIIGKGS